MSAAAAASANTPATGGKTSKPKRKKRLLKYAIIACSVLCIVTLFWDAIYAVLFAPSGSSSSGSSCPMFAREGGLTAGDASGARSKCPIGLGSSSSAEAPPEHPPPQSSEPAVDTPPQSSEPAVDTPTGAANQSRSFSEDELEEFDGTDPNKPILLSYLGRVYDVSIAREVYGPGMSYSKFAGRACTRGVALPSLEDLDVSDEIGDFDQEQRASLEHWEQFYQNKYQQVGTLIPDPNAAQRVAARAAKASESKEAKQRQKAAAAEQAKQMVGKIFTKAELAGFNGSDESVPVYISVAGHVLDVSGSRNLFGRGKPRGCWSGRDATMAIIAKTCDEKELARSWSSAQQHETTQLEQSLQFFLSKYPKVGSLEGWSGDRGRPPQVKSVSTKLAADQQSVTVSWNALSANEADGYLIFAQDADSDKPVQVSEQLLASRYRTQRPEYSLSLDSFNTAKSASQWRFYVVASSHGIQGPLSIADSFSQISITK